MADDKTPKDQGRGREESSGGSTGKYIRNEDRHIVEKVERPSSWPPPPERKEK